MHTQVAKAIAAVATLLPVASSHAPDQELRRARLAELLDSDEFGGVRAELARFLGLASGAYIRQLLEGERPITEKLVEKIEGAHGGKYRGWFGARAMPTYSAAALRVAAIYDQVGPRDRRHIDAAADAASSPDNPDPGPMDSDVQLLPAPRSSPGRRS